MRVPPLPIGSAVIQALLQRTLEEVPDTGVEEKETFGLFHEALRPLAHRFVPACVQMYAGLVEGAKASACVATKRVDDPAVPLAKTSDFGQASWCSRSQVERC